jgi:predicted transcriptional regulator
VAKIKNIGPLEEKVMNILWKKKEASAREIWRALGKKEEYAYSTVRTILTRLVEKKIVSQKMNEDERMYIYTPILTKNELERKIIRGTLDNLLKRFEKSTISYLAGSLSESDEDIEKIKKKLEEMKKDV